MSWNWKNVWGFVKRTQRAQRAIAGCLAGAVIALAAGASPTEIAADISVSSQSSEVFSVSSQESSETSSAVSSEVSSEISSQEPSSSDTSSSEELDYTEIEIKSETEVVSKDSETAKTEDALYPNNGKKPGGEEEVPVKDPVPPPSSVVPDSPSSNVSSSGSSGSTSSPGSSAGSSSGSSSSGSTVIVPKAVYGIDVSYYQGNINWQLVKDSGIEFVIIRVGYRGYGTGKLCLDNKFSEYIQGAKASGLKVGAYFFSQALNEEEAREEAAFMLQYLQGYSLDFPVAYDMENWDPEYRTYGLSQQQITKNSVVFCEVVKAAGYTPMVYYGRGNYQNFDTALLSSRYKIWFAHYTSQTDYTGHYDIWQFTSQAKCPGISGNVDKNVMYVNVEEQAYTVTYNANEGSSPPSDSQKYTLGSNVTLAQPGNMTREGYTFSGWNTRADGSGTSYAPGSVYKNISANLTLYAMWTPITYQVTYNANGGETPPVDAGKYTTGQTATVLAAGNMKNNGKQFLHWNTQANGKGASYLPGDQILNIQSNITRYAQWSDSVSSDAIVPQEESGSN